MPKSVTVFEAVPHQPEADSFDFTRSWMGLRHACAAHKLLILGTCLFTIALTVAYVRVWPPTYVTEVPLMGQSEKDMSRESFYETWNVFRNNALADEVHVLTSATVLSAVIAKLNLTEDQVYHSFFGYVGYLWVTSWVGRTYHHFKAWLFPPAHSPYDPTPEQIAGGRVLKALESGVQLDAVPDTDVGRLVVRGPTPRVAEIANTIVQVYFEQRRARQVAEAQDDYDALDTERKKAAAEVAGIEDTMRKYYSANDMLLDFEKDKLDVGQTNGLKAAIEDLKTDIAGNEAALHELDDELAQQTKTVVAARITQVNPIKDSLESSLVNLKIQRKQTLINYRPDSPEVADIDRQIAIVTDRINQEPEIKLREATTALSSEYETLRSKADLLRATLAGQRANLDAKTAIYAELRTAVQTIPEKMRVVHDLERDLAEADKKLSAIEDKMMIAAVSRATAQTSYSAIHVIDQAAAPGEPVWPMTKLLLLGAAAMGLIAGVLLALLMDLFFGRVHRFRLASAGRELPIYAIVRRDQGLARDLFALPTLRDGPRRSLTWPGE